MAEEYFEEEMISYFKAIFQEEWKVAMVYFELAKEHTKETLITII